MAAVSEKVDSQQLKANSRKKKQFDTKHTGRGPSQLRVNSSAPLHLRVRPQGLLSNRTCKQSIVTGGMRKSQGRSPQLTVHRCRPCNKKSWLDAGATKGKGGLENCAVRHGAGVLQCLQDLHFGKKVP